MVTPRVGLLRVCVRVCVCVCVSVLHTSDSVSFRQRRFDPDCWCGMPWLCGCKAAWRLPHVESSVLLLAMYVRRTSPACMDTHTNVHQKHTHTRTHAHTHTHSHIPVHCKPGSWKGLPCHLQGQAAGQRRQLRILRTRSAQSNPFDSPQT